MTLKDNVKDENNNAKISTTFSKYIKNVPNEDDGILVWFEVSYLYRKTPITDMLNISKDYVNNLLREFLNLANLVLTTTWYTFNSQF